jgi:filamentous hemagglutinin
MTLNRLGNCSIRWTLAIGALSVACLYSPAAFAQTCTTGISPCTIPSSTAGYVGQPGTASYTYGTIANTGNIQIIAGGASNQNTLLNVEAGAYNSTTTLTGSGTLTLSTSGGTGTAIIQDGTFAGNNSLVNLNNSIQGFGNIGQGSDLVLSNSGTIDANVSGQSLLLNGLPVTNSVGSTGGLLEATNGGFLVLQNAINNLNANLTASGTGSTVYVGSSIQGGTIGSSAGGVFQSYSGGSAVLDGLTQGQLTLATGTTFTGVAGTVTGIAGAIDNQGNIQAVAGTSQNATLGVGLGYRTNTTLTGGGTITLSSSGGTGVAIVSDATFAGGNTLTNGTASSAHTIQGYGQIGNGSDLGLTNSALGIINANVSGQTLFLNPGNTIANTGLLEATNGGNLQISATINNLNGTISTDSGLGSTVNVSSTIQGGTLTGTLQTNGTATLDGSTQGALTLSTGSIYSGGPGTNTSIAGAIDNHGDIQIVAGGGQNATLGIGLGYFNGATLTGGGTVTLSSSDGTGVAIISDATFAGGNNLTNGSASSAHTIQGYGQIGNGSDLTLTNAALGIVNANVSGQTLTLNGGTVTNTGLLEATNGGNLQISATINNLNGTISTDSGLGSTVNVSSTIQGGTLTGTLQTNGAATLDGSTQGTLTLSTGTTYTAGAGTTTQIFGNIKNQGNIQIAAGGGQNAVLSVGGGGYGNNATLTGGGTITLSGGVGATAIILDGTFAGGNTLTNSNNTIQGYGSIGYASDLKVINGAGGTLLANVAGQTLSVTGTGGLTNNGTMQANAGSTLLVTQSFTNFSGGTLTGGTYNVYGTGSSAGTIQIDALGTGGGEITTNDASITLDGVNSNFLDGGGLNALSALADNGGYLAILDGRNFSTLGSFDNTGTLDIGSTDTLTVSGGFDPPAGDVIFDISGLGVNGFLDVTGAADFGGTLSLDTANGFNLAAGDTFYLAEYDSRGGTTFGSIDTSGLDLAAGLTAEVLYDQGANNNEVELIINGTTSATPEPSTWLLFAGGLGAIAAFRVARRRGNMAEGAAKDSCA